MMRNATVVFIHGFWSSPATWDRVAGRLGSDPDLADLTMNRFGYESPKLPPLRILPFRIPGLVDIALDLESHLRFQLPDTPLAIVTHSQGGLVLQRYLARVVSEGRGAELDRIELIVMLACPNEGSEYLGSLRRAVGFGRHPQARDLETLNADVADAHRAVIHHVRIPIHAFSGSSDNVVPRASGQGTFKNAGSLPGDHFSILDPDLPGSSTVPALKNLLIQAFEQDPPRSPRPNEPKYHVEFHGPTAHTHIGDGLESSDH